MTPSKSVRAQLADAVRRINSEHHRIGRPEIPALYEAWHRLDRALAMATVAGDEDAAETAINAYMTAATRAIREYDHDHR